MELHREFIAAVDNYKEFQKKLARDKVIQSLEQLKIVNPKQTFTVTINDVSFIYPIGEMKIAYGINNEIIIYKK